MGKGGNHNYVQTLDRTAFTLWHAVRKLIIRFFIGYWKKELGWISIRPFSIYIPSPKEDFELGHGHAMALFALFKGVKKEGDK